MSGPTDALDGNRPIPGDDAGELTLTLRNIKQQLVDNKGVGDANALVLAGLGNAATRNITVSTSLPDPLVGVDGDIWLQIDP